MRGKAASIVGGDNLAGITPAYAGKSTGGGLSGFCRGDHPRVCGEKCNCGVLSVNLMGSPPRMRGKVRQCSPLSGGSWDHPRVCGEKHARYLREMAFTGITPTYAGKRLKRSRSTVPHAAIVPLFPSVCNKPAGSDGSPAGHDAPPFLPIENAAPASPAYNLRSL